MTSIRLPDGWNWDDIVGRLDERIDLSGSCRSSGALRRTRVIKTAEQLLRLVLAYVLSGLSFRGTAAWAEAGGHASFSDVALLKRVRRCGPWLRDIVQCLAAQSCPEACASEARRIVAVDATMICAPGDKLNYHLLHTVYDVTAQCFRSTELTDRHTAERLDVGEISQGEIRIADRAYARWRGLRAVVDAGADYVVRLSAKACLTLRTPAGETICRAAICRQAETAVQDIALVIHDGKGADAMPGRLIVLALPQEQAAAARRTMRKKASKWGYAPTQEALATAGCVMLVTSLPCEEWPPRRILDLYRRRWQVELAFKRLKSLIGLEQLRLHDSELIGVWIHAVLLVALLIDTKRPARTCAVPDSPHWEHRSGNPFHCGASTQ